MKNRDIEKRLKAAFTGAVPDTFDRIADSAASSRGVTMSITQENLKQKYIRYALTAAAAAALIAGVVLIASVVRSREAVSTLTIEGSDCVEISLSREGRPLAMSGRDASSQRVVNAVTRDYPSLSDAVDCVLDAMLDTGSLSDDSNTVLITAEGEDADAVLGQLGDAVEAAKASFGDSGYSGAILSTVASTDKNIVNISKRNKVTIGKAEMVHDIIAACSSFSAAGLCRLSINDLNLLCDDRDIEYASIDVYGVSRGCITTLRATELAVGFFGDPTAHAYAELSCDSGGLVYRVWVSGTAGDRYCVMSAATGELISCDDGSSGVNTAANTPASQESPTAVAPTERTASGGGIAATPTLPVSPDTPAAHPTEAAKPTEAPAQRPSEPERPAPTSPPAPEPDIFTRAMYYRYESGIYDSDILPAAARQISLRRVSNGYDTYYDSGSFPYAAQGTQGGITALVFNTVQFRNLTGTDDDRFNDDYFRTHVLYVYMNRDADYHWTKSIDSAYVNGSVLYIEDAEPIGRYVGDQETKIHTTIYELNKDDLRSFTDMLEFE